MTSRRRHRANAALLGFGLGLAGCAQLLSLDDLAVKPGPSAAGNADQDAASGASGSGGSNASGSGGVSASGSGGAAGAVAGNGGGGSGGASGTSGNGGVAGGGASGSGGAGAAGVSGSAGASGSGGNAGIAGASGASGDAGSGGMLDGGADANDAADAPSDALDEDAMMPLVGIRPPTRPDGNPTPSGAKSRAFIFRDLYFGSIDPTSGQPDSTAWTKLGYDIDGRCTSAADSSSTMPGTCQKPSGAASDTLVDGDNCRDNNFGSQLIHFISQLDSNTEPRINMAIANGGSTLMLVLDDLDDASMDTYAPGRLFLAASIEGGDAGVPKWDGTDIRPVDSDSLAGDGTDLTMPKQAFLAGYVTGDTWVSGDFNMTPAEFTLQLSGEPAHFVAESLTIALHLSPDHTTVLDATISAAISSVNVVKALTPAAQALTQCSAAAASVYLSAIPKWSDLASGAPNFLDTTRTCDTMSLGAAVAVSPVMMPTMIVTPPATPPPCPDAGM